MIPAASISCAIGRTFAACLSWLPRAQARPAPSCGQRSARPLGNERPLLLGEGGVELEDEGINVYPQLGHHERHPMRHRAGDEGHTTGQSIRLSDVRGLPRLSSVGQSGGELWVPVQGVATIVWTSADGLNPVARPVRRAALRTAAQPKSTPRAVPAPGGAHAGLVEHPTVCAFMVLSDTPGAFVVSVRTRPLLPNSAAACASVMVSPTSRCSRSADPSIEACESTIWTTTRACHRLRSGARKLAALIHGHGSDSLAGVA